MSTDKVSIEYLTGEQLGLVETTATISEVVTQLKLPLDTDLALSDGTFVTDLANLGGKQAFAVPTKIVDADTLRKKRIQKDLALLRKYGMISCIQQSLRKNNFVSVSHRGAEKIMERNEEFAQLLTTSGSHFEIGSKVGAVLSAVRRAFSAYGYHCKYSQTGSVFIRLFPE